MLALTVLGDILHILGAIVTFLVARVAGLLRRQNWVSHMFMESNFL